MPLKPEEKNLLVLQEIDLKLTQLLHQLENAPYKQRIAVLRAKISEGEKRLAVIEKARTDLEGKIMVLEDEVSEFNSRMSAKQSVLQKSVDHREVEALSRELESLVKQKDKRENEGIGLMEKRSAFGVAQRDTQEKLTRLRDVEAKEFAAYQQFIQKAQEMQTMLDGRRSELVDDISSDVLTRYERIRVAKGGIGVARYKYGKCEGCSVMIPVAQQAAIEGAEGITTCPTCKRLLIVDDES